MGTKQGIGKTSDSWIQEQGQIWPQKRNYLCEVRKRTGNLNVSSISLSMYPEHWPHHHLKALAKLCMLIPRQEMPCSVCIFARALPPRCSFSTSRSSCPNCPLPPRSESHPPPLLGRLLWELSLTPKPPDFTAPMNGNRAPGGRAVSLRRSLSQQEQESLPSFGTAP